MPALTESQWEEITLSHWRERIPAMEEFDFSIRVNDRQVLFRSLPVVGAAVTVDHVEPPECPAVGEP
jgi:hypothetical protein